MMNALDISQTYFANAAASSASALQNKDSAKEAAQDFEAFFLSRMCESMFEGVSTEGIFGGGHAEKVYRSLLLNEYGKIMAQNGGYAKLYVTQKALEEGYKSIAGTSEAAV